MPASPEAVDPGLAQVFTKGYYPQPRKENQMPQKKATAAKRSKKLRKSKKLAETKPLAVNAYLYVDGRPGPS